MPEPQNIRLLLCDADGVLTDGSIIVDDAGVELRRFHVRDGLGIQAAMGVGLQVGVISGRIAQATAKRLQYLGITLVMQGQADKGAALLAACQAAGVPPEATAFIGDDLIDLPALKRCGYPMAVADAVDEVQAAARFITPQPGGRGAVRAAIEHILRAQNKWSLIVNRYMQA